MLSDFEEQRRTQEFDHALAFERQRQSHTLGSQRQQYEQDLDERERDHRHGASTADQTNELLLEQERREFALRAARLTKEQVGDSPTEAAHLAHAAGSLDPLELMRVLQQEEGNQRAARRLREARDAEVRRELLINLIKEGHTAHTNIDVGSLIQEAVGAQALGTGPADPEAPAIGPAARRTTVDPNEDEPDEFAPESLDESIKGLREEDDY